MARSNPSESRHELLVGALLREDLEASLKLGFTTRNAEFVTLGVMSKDKPFECLALVNQLFSKESEFLAETSSKEALHVFGRLASAEARKGKLPLGPRGWGDFLTLSVTLQPHP